MSSRTVSNNKPRKTPFCKVCFDAGKSEAVYTGHYVKNQQGKVTCITLLTQCCSNCNKVGHTKKHCNTVAKAKIQLTGTIDFAAKKPTTKMLCIGIPANRFANIGNHDDDDDDDDDINDDATAKKTDEKIKMPVPIRKRILNWADVESDSDSD